MFDSLKHFFFCEVTRVVKTGQRKILSFDDLLEVPNELKVDESSEVGRVNLTSEKHLIRQLILENKLLIFRGWMFYVLGIMASLSSPVLINLFVTRLSLLNQSDKILSETILIALSMGLSGILMGIGFQHNFSSVLKANVKIVARLNRLIFEHALKLSQKSKQKINVGDVVNHMSADSEVIADVPLMLGDLGWALLLLLGTTSMLVFYLGWTSLLAIVSIVFMMMLTKRVGKNFMTLEEEMMKFRDRRVSLMSQILQSIRLVKYFSWRNEILNQVGTVRKNEIHARRKLAQVEMLSGLSFVAISTLVLFLVLWVHIARGFTLTPALVLTCVSLFSLLQEPIGHLPGVLSRLINAWVGARRIINFLSTETSGEMQVDPSVFLDGKAVVFNQVDLKVEGQNFNLRGLNFSIELKSKVAIVGEVGSGKSTILQLILGEYAPTSGSVVLGSRKIGYVPQEHFIMNSSLQGNINFGEERFSPSEIERALYVSDLKKDIQHLPSGLMTEIGERGVNLSGGQKQRVSLARCFLHNADLVLLDDPLSAVDSETEQNIINRLFFDSWNEKTIVLTTHRLEVLKKVDRILFMVDGKIEADGSLNKLMNESKKFVDFYSHHEDFSTEHAAVDDSQKVQDIPKEKESTLMTDEDRELGAVKGSLYWDYIKALGGNGRSQQAVISLLILGVFAMTLLPLLNQWWLSWFTSHPLRISPIEGVLVYGAIACITLASQVSNQYFWLQRGIKAGVELHDQMLEQILKAPVRFFDTTPVGRLLQRFSRDLESVDVQLQWNFESALQSLIQILVSLFLIIFSVPFILLILLPLGFFYWSLQSAYRASARETKRMDSIHRSPRYAHFKETLGGLPVIRAYKREDWFRSHFFLNLKNSQRVTINNFLLNRWFSIRIPLIGGIITCATGLCLIYSVSYSLLTPAMGGLVILYSISFWSALNWGVRIFSELESRMTSIERIRFMTRVPSEKRIAKEPEVIVDAAWPNQGEIKFKSVSARYDHSLPDVVKDLDLLIPAQSQIGIVGRTGAGKTTVFQMLYRFIDLHQGSIEIDGVDIACLDVDILRSRLAIIPQDPVLFMGTLRSNLDPYFKKSDSEIWRILECTGLSEFVKNIPLGLSLAIFDGGVNFSQGQRQLICLARALLLDSKIIMLDEATASVDVVTDHKIQKVLKKELKGKTVLIIAHRLSTVADLDHLVVMDGGRVKSIGIPAKLFETNTIDHLGLKE